jgi:hypothetical protein
MTKLHGCRSIALVALFSAQLYGASILPSAEGEVAQTGLGTIVGPFNSGYPFVGVGTINGRLQGGIAGLPNAVQAIFEFDVSALDGSAISDAKFSFTVSLITTETGFMCFDLQPCPPVLGLNFSISQGDGIVSTNDWNSGVLFGSISHPTFGIPLAVDVTAALNSLLTSNAGFVTIDVSALGGQDGEDGVMMQPSLIVSQVPEPASYTLFAVGALSLLFIRNTHRHT